MQKLKILLLLLGFAALRPVYARKAKPIDHAFVDSVFSYICKSGIQYPLIVMRQAIIETGWFRAPFLMKRNNLFGFRSRHYLRFASWQESIDYYKAWQDKWYNPSYKSYYRFLVKIRYARKGYIKLLKKIKYSKTCEALN